MSHRKLWAGVLLGFVLAGCSEGKLTSAPAGVALADPVVDFGRVYTGDVERREVRIRNTGATTETVTVRQEGSPSFRATGTTLTLEPGTTKGVEVMLTVRSIGPLEGALLVESNDGSPLRATLLAEAKEMQHCPMPDPCTDNVFDRGADACARKRKDTGAKCHSPNRCLAQTTCSASGDCVGDAVDCDDHSVCTTDSCNPALGCLHVSTAGQCKASGPCKVPYCDAAKGCQERDAAEGSLCGAKDCTEKNVCRAGVCVKEAVAEGESCGYSGPCHDPGLCAGGQCVEKQLTTMRRRFQYTPAQAGKDRAAMAFAPLLDADGQSYFGERTGDGLVLRSLSGDGVVRWTSEVMEGGEAALQDASNHLLSGGRLHYLTADCNLVSVDLGSGKTLRSVPLPAASGEAAALRCTSLSAAPLGQLAVAGVGCTGVRRPECKAFMGIVAPDQKFTYRLYGATGQDLTVGPLSFDGGARLITAVKGAGPPQLLAVAPDLTLAWSANWEGRTAAVALGNGTLLEGHGVLLDVTTGKRLGTLPLPGGAQSQAVASTPLLNGKNAWLLSWDCAATGCDGSFTLSVHAFDGNNLSWSKQVVSARPNPVTGALPFASMAIDRSEALYVAAGDAMRAYVARSGADVFACPVSSGGVHRGGVAVGVGTVHLLTADSLVGVDVGWARPAEHGWMRTGGNNATDGAALP